MDFQIKKGRCSAMMRKGLILAMVIGSVACNDAPTQKTETRRGRSDSPAAFFDRDSAYAFVARQVAFGPRTSGSRAHARCADYLYGVLGGYADTVLRQSFTAGRWDGQVMQGVNIIACFAPEKTRRILLAAHWDSRPYADQEADPALHHQAIDGANDGASGVGVLLEVARVLSAHPQAVGVDIVLFDLEDAGRPDFEPYKPGDEATWCKGAQYWAVNPHQPGYTAVYGILLDMVGNRQPMFAQ
ncbi:MAG: M28 family peptidase, partial [Bacteroidales bacterium]|nr:M28 family peptidase [Bacteroidales bacterium]